MERLIAKIESYNYECEAGPLTNCIDWHNLVINIAEAKATGKREAAESILQIMATERDAWSTNSIEAVTALDDLEYLINEYLAKEV